MAKETGEFRFLDPKLRHIEGFYRESPRLVPSAADGSMYLNTRPSLKASVQVASDLPSTDRAKVLEGLEKKIINAIATEQSYVVFDLKTEQPVTKK